MLQGKIMVCYAAFVLLHIDLVSSIEMCDSLFRNKSSLAYTDIFYGFYKAYIPELRLRLGSGVAYVETNPAPIVTDFDVSLTISPPHSQRRLCSKLSNLHCLSTP